MQLIKYPPIRITQFKMSANIIKFKDNIQAIIVMITVHWTAKTTVFEA